MEEESLLELELELLDLLTSFSICTGGKLLIGLSSPISTSSSPASSFWSLCTTRFCSSIPNLAFSSKIICLLFGSLALGFGNLPDLGSTNGGREGFSAGTETGAFETRRG
nr:hypothetical protein Iba_scaffold2753CG0480 [Ipomoea batatas]